MIDSRSMAIYPHKVYIISYKSVHLWPKPTNYRLSSGQVIKSGHNFQFAASMRYEERGLKESIGSRK